MGWTSAGQAASWRFRLKTPGTYKVAAVTKVHRGRKELYGEPDVEAVVNGTDVRGKVDLDTLDMSEASKVYQFLPTELGEVTFDAAGDYTLNLTAAKFGLREQTAFQPDTPRGFSLVAVRLTPA